MSTLTLDRLRDAMTYDPVTGLFTCKVTRGRIAAGSLAGSLHAHGYRVISIDRRGYGAHRLAWLYMHGSFPSGVIDHINGVRDDNRIANLRDVTHQINAENRSRPRAGKALPFLGVRKQTLTNTFHASIKVGGKVKALGGFTTPELAHAAYLAAKARYHIGARAAFES